MRAIIVVISLPDFWILARVIDPAGDSGDKTPKQWYFSSKIILVLVFI